MLLTFLQTILKILVFALLFSVEISVAIPIVSLVFIFSVVDRERPMSQVFLALASSLIISSFISLSWSVVLLLLGLAWLVVQYLPNFSPQKLTAQNIILVVSVLMGTILASLSRLTFNYKTALYTVLFIGIAVLLSRVLVPRRMRHSVINWIAPQKAA